MKAIIPVLLLAAALTACNSSNDRAAGTTSPAQLGATTTFARTDGLPVGTFRVTDAITLPTDCVVELSEPSGQFLGIRVEIDNPGDLTLPRPDMYTTRVIDAAGVTHDVDNAVISSRCEHLYPDIASSESRSKTAGWVAFELSQPDPATLVYTPIVAEGGTSLSDIEWAAMSPPAVRVQLPTPLPTGAGDSATAESPTTTPGAPLSAPPTVEDSQPPTVGEACDVDGNLWAVDADGGQLHCTYAGTSSPRWVESLPFIGTREVGDPCTDDGVAEDLQGRPLICLGEQGWQPGP